VSEDPPPPYLSRTFVCRVCRQPFTPSPLEAEALAALEQLFGLDAVLAEATCEECERAGHG
jgi:hypothetical protein